MDILAGSRKIPTRKRNRGRPKLKEIKPQVLPSTLQPSRFGCDPKKLRCDEDPTCDLSDKKPKFFHQGMKEFQSLPEMEIVSISHSLFSHEELEQMAVFEATNTDKSGINSVNDPRSGTVGKNPCNTCYMDSLRCPGHYGIIKLNVPIIHPMFKSEVLSILTSVCNSCGDLLLNEDKFSKFSGLTGSKRLKEIAKESEKLPCRRKINTTEEGIIACMDNPTYIHSKIKEVDSIMYISDKIENKRTVEEIQRIFESISPEDAELLGFENGSHPIQFILRSIPIIPICARAPVVQKGILMMDDITTMYLDIVRQNQELLKAKTEIKKEELIKGLNFKIAHLINNTDAQYTQGTQKVYQGIKSRIQGKRAIIRSLLMGKRVNFSGRTVLGPEPNVKFGQIRIPRAMAKVLTINEIVTPANITRLTYLFKNKKTSHITQSEGRNAGKRIRSTEKVIDENNLIIGDSVDRFLQDGDYVVFNRQPTLHKQGFMGYEVVLGSSLTIGLHLGYTPQHNADFDGDEGVIHVAQSYEAIKEIAMLMNVKNQIMNAQTNKNIAGATFDALVGIYLLTFEGTMLDIDVSGRSLLYLDIISFLENKDSIETLDERLEKYNVPAFSGKALFSALLPIDFYYRKGDVYIRDGVLISGTITKDHIGSSHGSIIQAMYKIYGQDRVVDFLTDLYNMSGQYLDTIGFSVGLDDCLLQGDDPQKLIQYEVQRAKMLVKAMGIKLDDPLEEERREKQIMAYLNTAKGLGGRISAERLGPNNAFNIMAKSGAKGSIINIAKITGILGQQFVKGQRMPESMSGGTRSLPYFPENSLDPAARGFISNSFLSGLSPAEMFFHQAGGREGLTDTAIKTADTGEMHHKMVKAMEDVKVYNDGSVRNAFGDIFQFSYGEDGFDAGMLESVTTKSGSFASFINIKRMAGKINSKYGYDTPK